MQFKPGFTYINAKESIKNVSKFHFNFLFHKLIDLLTINWFLKVRKIKQPLSNFPMIILANFKQLS